MKTFRHYSFDLWLTLIKSNPDYKSERAGIFYRDYNSQKKPLEEIAAIFRQVDMMCNAINEKSGKNIDSDEMYLMVLIMISEDPSYIKSVDVAGLYVDMENLVLNNLPLIYDNETIGVIKHLKEKGNTLSILSNTGFIKGSVLRKVIAELRAGDYFDFQLYSDEAGLSKPNPEFFKMMIAGAKHANQPDEIGLTDIIHIGDNTFTDINGAAQAGINSLLVNSNKNSIATLLSR